MKVSAMLLCDFYKLAHREMYPEGTEIRNRLVGKV
jgi:nicotinic acid phosphoribosyltransferase